MGDPVRPVAQERLEAAVSFRLFILPRPGDGAVSDLPAAGRRGAVGTSARRADVHALPAVGQSALRHRHGPGRKGDPGGETVKENMENMGQTVFINGDKKYRLSPISMIWRYLKRHSRLSPKLKILSKSDS